MKLQDVVFVVLLFLLLLFRKKKLLVMVGLLCWGAALPLFIQWIFFTAERLTIYGAIFLFLSFLIPKKRESTVQ